MKRKLTALILTAVMLCTTGLLFTGCGPEEYVAEGVGNTGEDITVMLLANATETVFYNKYFDELEEKYGITITYTGYEEGDYYQRLKAVMQSGGTPDIFYVRPNEILTHADKIRSLEKYSKSDAFKEAVNLSDIYESAIDMYRYNPSTGKLDEKNGELYAFPKDLSSQQLGYNKKILERFETQIKAGVPGIKMPWEMNFATENYTWDQYEKMCRIIAKEGKADEISASDVPDIQILLKSFGGQLLDPNDSSKVTVDTDAFKSALALQKQLVTKDANGVAACDYKGGTYARFADTLKVAFYGACGSWEITNYHNKEEANPTEFEWGLMPWPTVDGSTNWYGKITSAGYVVSKDSKNPDVAMEIAASFITPQLQQRMVVDEQITLPLSKTVAAQYILSDYNDTYYPSTRSVYIDVISGTHGFFPAEYRTESELWKDILDGDQGELPKLWNADGNYNIDVAELQRRMQNQMND